MNRIFGNLKMKWPSVVLFAIIAGVYTGVVLMIDALKDTSFQDIGIAYEWWVIFAVVIVVNCEKNWEAMLKCFVFFLISQPLVFAVQIAFGPLSVAKAWYYYRAIWLPMTMLTLPGGFIAYYCKKQNALGAVILGLGNTIQAALGVSYFAKMINDFPHHLLSGIVCFASIGVMSFAIQKKKANCAIAIVLPLLLAAALVAFVIINNRTLF